MAEQTFDFGMIGLGTMGRNLLLNMAEHGTSVAGLDTDPPKAAALKTEGAGKQVEGTTDPKAFVAMLRKPRAIMLLVPAGAPVDSVIKELSPLLDKGDIIIDGGNSFFQDTDRRSKELAAQGLEFLGVGVSGGESGARHGPSMMPGGAPEAYERVRQTLESVAAKYNGEPCVALMGTGSAGHYVKMVHNGIEYGVMQLIAETYDVMRRGLGMPMWQCRKTFAKWNEGRPRELPHRDHRDRARKERGGGVLGRAHLRQGQAERHREMGLARCDGPRSPTPDDRRPPSRRENCPA